MILGMPVATFTTLHVIISLVAIATGFFVAIAMMRGNHTPLLTGIFLATTILTSVTGFMFPAAGVTPGQIVGAISLVALVISVLALYGFELKGPWRTAYIVTAILALYLNTFVLVVQGFQKIQPLSRLAPTQSEPPFAIAQFSVLVALLAVGWVALRQFHPNRTMR